MRLACPQVVGSAPDCYIIKGKTNYPEAVRVNLAFIDPDDKYVVHVHYQTAPTKLHWPPDVGCASTE